MWPDYTLLSELLPLLACFMASDAAAAAFNGAGALILHLLQPFYRSGYGLACRGRERERESQILSPFLCSLELFA